MRPATGTMPPSICRTVATPEPSSPARPTTSPAASGRSRSATPGRRTAQRDRDRTAPSAAAGSRAFVGKLADHAAGDRRDVGLGGPPASLDAAVAQHRQAIGDRENLVEPVRHENHRRLARDDRTDGVEQPLGLGLRQRGCRLVEDEDGAAGAERAGDLDELPVRQRQVADPAAQVDGGAEPVHRRLDLPAVGAAAEDRQGRGRQHARDDVLLHRAVREQHQFLMHDDQAGPARLRQRAGRHLAPGNGQPSAVGPDGAAEHPDQGRFAGAVGAEQPMHLAGGDGQRNVVERADAAERLADVLGLQQRPARRFAHPRKRASRTR